MLPASKPDEGAEVRRYAQLILQNAGVGDKLPTPVADIVACAELVVSNDITLSEVHTDFFTRSFGVAKAAIAKLMGLVDLRQKVIYLDTTMIREKQTFVKLHEVGHKVLPWQRATYMYLDDETTLAPEVGDLFEQEANRFAADVLFQVDRFKHDAADLPLSIRSPLALARRYGASAHASIRRYVEANNRACALVIADLLPEIEGQGSFLRVKHVVRSAKFDHRFPHMKWARRLECGLPYVLPILRGARFVEGHEIDLLDQAGQQVRCKVAVFSNTYTIFILIWPADEKVRSKTKIEIVR